MVDKNEKVEIKLTKKVEKQKNRIDQKDRQNKRVEKVEKHSDEKMLTHRFVLLAILTFLAVYFFCCRTYGCRHFCCRPFFAPRLNNNLKQIGKQNCFLLRFQFAGD